MRTVRRIRAAPLAAALLSTLGVAAAGTPSPNIQLASSAQLVLEGSIHRHDIVLQVTRAAGGTPIEGAGNLTAQLDGRAVPVAARGASYVLSTQGFKGGPQALQVVVAHDGIHELLSATVRLPKPPERLAALEKHGYAAWWVLNIVVLLLAARLIMRRKKPTPRAPSQRAAGLSAGPARTDRAAVRAGCPRPAPRRH
ncbi:MAG: hypothetical protein M0038_14070 [Pseudomonadota bacterium]|jgi:hypothetical protein|nr:hypothetical protein [Pseudomonadota bacterium]